MYQRILGFLYVYAFVHPNSGRSVWYLLPALNTASFQAVLENFARDVLDGAGKRALVVMDNAAWHKSNVLSVPDGLKLGYDNLKNEEYRPCLFSSVRNN